jgi:2-polyprenyl-3-methyl-5-hydroxy-6-metoxy-1,4-benzoquinol methylase
MEGLTAARLSTDGRIKDVRADHTARYEWAAERIQGHVIDAGCNCGYGAAILADAGLIVTAFDYWFQGLEYARWHWDRPAIVWAKADFESDFSFPFADAVVAFEVIEHLGDPRPLLTEARRVAGRLLASVPNQDVWPWAPRLGPVHKRHYTRGQFEALLNESGWRVTGWWGQENGDSPVQPDVHGRTLVVECH